MAATAGSVAAGSVVGHGLSNMLFGGRSEAPAAPAAQAAPVQQYSANCEVQAKGELINMLVESSTDAGLYTDFSKCIDKADLDTCRYYLEQLKAVRPHVQYHFVRF
jgi:coiled-coil-helix-coiled-coil-helix domain-containing protein 2